MRKKKLWMLAAILFISGTGLQAQTKRSDDFRARYELKEVVVMSRHNIRSPISSGSAAYQRVTPHTWFAWSSPSSQLSLRGGVLETEMTGGYTLVNSVADALVLQCYESENFAPFGHELTMEQWHDICAVKEVYDGLLFTPHSAAVNLAYPLVSRIREELNRSDRKFMFLCGHDSNLASISAALSLQLPETENALELHTPIGSKLVFEKWSDGIDEFVAINLVYQSVSQLQNRTLLSTDVPPMVLPVTIEGLTANADGLYRLADLDAHIAIAMAEYEAIEDVPTAVSAASHTETASQPAAIYNLQGQRLDTLQHGVNILGGKKIVVE